MIAGQKHHWGWFSAALAALCIIIYGNTLRNDYALDDKFIITENKFTQKGFAGIPDLLTSSYWKGTEANVRSYRPLAPMTFALEVGLWGNKPAICHLINLIIYIITGLVLLYFVRQVFSLADPKIPPVISLIATALFLAHPVHTEAVANIKSRDTLFELLFVLISAMLLLKYLKNNHIWPLAGSIFSFFLALFSKESAITFVLLVPVIIVLFFRKSPGKTVLISMLYLIPVIVFLICYANFSGYREFGQMHFLNNVLATSAPWGTIWATKFYILGKYLFLLIMPYPLVYDYSYNQVPLTGFSNPVVWVSLMIYLSALFFLIMVLYRKIKRIPVNPGSLLVAYAISWFFMGLFVSSNLVILIGSTMGERFLYIPSLGFIMIFVYGLYTLFNLKVMKKLPGGVNRIGFFLLVSGLLVCYSIQTMERNTAWRDDFTLCSHDIRYLGNNVKANIFLAYLYRQKGDQATDSASRTAYYQNAIGFNEKALSIYGRLTDVEQSLAFLYGSTGNYGKAVEKYQAVIQANPGVAGNYIQIGKALGFMGQYRKGIEFLLQGEKISPGHPELMSLLGIFYAKSGEPSNAVSWFEKLLDKDPSNRQAKEYVDWVNRTKQRR